MKYAVHFLEPEQECALMVSIAMLLSTSEKLQAVWPDAAALKERFDPTDVEVVVVPLQRIGAPSGKSGAEVFVVYMRSVKQEAGSLKPSNALVVKLQKRADKLTNEMKAADEWPMGASGKFAKPLVLYSVRGHTVLVAPFRASVMSIPDEHRLKFQVVLDLYRIILDEDDPSAAEPARQKSVKACVAEAIDLVAKVHQGSESDAGYARRELRYSEAYAWYLRGTPTEGRARAAVAQLFGSAATVDAFGETWPNPVNLLERIVQKHDLFIGVAGPVHGDLHPKNIVFDEDKHANIIDFGWARNGMHVVVDYLLLDINLRAMTMASQVPENELLVAAKCLRSDDVSEGVSDPRLTARLGVIRDVIWTQAASNKAVSSETGDDWLKEYLIPYFLVAYGLLVYLDDARNQRALLASVLAAAKRIDSELPIST